MSAQQRPRKAVLAVPSSAITADYVERIRRYVRIWREATVHGPYLLTIDNVFDTLIDMYCDFDGEIVDPECRDGQLDFSCFETPGIRYWFRDNYFGPASCESIIRVRMESVPRHRFIATILIATDPEGSAKAGLIS